MLNKFPLSIFICVFFCLTNVSAQNSGAELFQPLSPSLRPPHSDNVPEFVKMTYQAQPNFKAIEAAFEAFERAEKAEKARKRKNTEGGQNNATTQQEEVENIYEVYYHRWRRAYEPFVQEDGTIVLPTVADYKRKIQTENSANQARAALRSGASNWTCVGPKETHWLKDHSATQAACPWQTNILAFDISKSNPNILYAGPETGGVFKTTDKGLTWAVCASSSFNFGGAAVAVEIHPTNPDIVYVAVNSFLWKSIDGGNTWTDLAACTATGVNDIALSPDNPDMIMIAAENGFFRYTPNDNTWTRIYTTACYDIEFNPSDATHVFILKSTGINIPSTDKTTIEFLKSTDSGASFTVKNLGFNTLTTGRLAVTPADGNRIYALCTSIPNPPKLLKSADEGETWTNMNAPFCTGGVSDADGGQGYYDLSIAASQTDANQLLFGLCSTAKAVSTDGGATFSYTHIGGYCGNFSIHPDLQEVKTVMNNGVMETWTGTDGGLTYSTDFFTSTNNASARNNGIFAVDFWGFSQGWNEDIMVGGRYHNGNTAMADFYPSGKALRMGGAEQGTGYVLHGNSRYAIFSDLGDGWILPNDFYSNSAGRFKYSKFPNEDGYGFDATPLVIHPYYFNQHFLGEGNSLWKTTDNGVTFVALKDFASRVRRFDVSRSNPSVMYVATDAGFNKSTDGGTTWSTVALPSGKSAGSLYLTINPTNDQDVWIAFKNVSGSGKVYQSTNGGGSWTVMDGTVLGSLQIKNITHTGGGVYIAADVHQGRVFYRSNNATDWTDFSTNLPVSVNILKMSPFFRDGKLRVATNRGIWESPLESDVAPVAQPIVNKVSTTCPKDTFYFDDYSMLKHAGATWAWSFSSPTNSSFTPQYVSNASARNPKVVFGAVGKYTVTLTVTNSAGTSAKPVTDMIDVTSDGNCDLSTVIGKAMSSTTNGDYLETPTINLNKEDGSNNNEVTLMAWVKPNGVQSAYCSIIGTTSGSVELIVRDNNKLGLAWNGATWDWTSGLTLTSNEWAHVALVVTPTDFKLYLNGKEAINTTDPAALDLATTWRIGIDRGETNRTFKGLIDEVCLYNRALTKEELREKMHLMKNPATDASLKGYYQFDESSGVVWNKARNGSSAFVGTVTRVLSTAPVAAGTSQRISATTGGIKNFSMANVSFELPISAILPDGDIVVSELDAAPDQMPSGGTPLSNKYWIVNNFGTNTTFTPLLNLKFNNLSGLTSPIANYKLYRRNFNADGATWGTTIDGADNLASNTLTFTPAAPCVGISSFGQFALTDDVSATPPVPSGDACVVGTVTGKSLSLTTTNQALQMQPNLSTTVTHFTTTAWIKPNGAQGNFAGIVSNGEWCAHCPTNTNGLVFDYGGTKLWYRWAGVDDTWSGNSGLTVPLNQWSYVAMVVTPDSVAIYLNDQKYLRVFGPTETVDKPTAATWDNLYVGFGHYSTYFKGEIEEVSVWNKALTQDQIREMRHLTKDNAFESDPNFLAYYQFNEQLNGKVINRARNIHGTLNGSATLSASTAPVGSGVSQRLDISSGGVKTFGTPEVDIEFPTSGFYANGEIVVTRLNVAPNLNPAVGTPLSNKYWIVNNYGANTTFSPLTSLKFNNLGSLSNPATNYKLYKRSANAEGATWGTTIDGADNLANSALTFTPAAVCSGLVDFGQFMITDDATTAAPTAPCIAQASPTNAASLTGVATSNIQSVVNAPNFGTSQNFTISFWFKSASVATDAVIVSDKNWGSGANKGWVFALQNGILRFNIGDRDIPTTHRIDITSVTALNDNKWHHVAASVTRGGNAILYIDGVNKASTSTAALVDIYSGNKLFIGTDANNAYPYAGLVDEIKIWNTALTQAEIREKRHLTTNLSETNLIGYYQFNTTTGSEYDLSNSGNNLTLNTNASRIASTAPVGSGTTFRMDVTTGGTKVFTGMDCEMVFPSTGTYPNGEVAVTKLTVSPDQLPSGGTPLSNTYWIINNYGTNASFSPLTSLKFTNLTGFGTGTASHFKLYKRTTNADGSTWGTTIDGADDLTMNNLTFTPPISCMGISSFGQFSITNDVATAAPSAAVAECNVSTVIGKAMKTTNNGDYMLTPAIDLGSSTDQITIMAWIRPDAGNQTQWAAILSCSTGVVVNLNYSNASNKLGLHWNDSQYNWDSGLTVPANEWSHVALVAAGTTLKLYLNGKEATNTANPIPINLANRQWFIGNDRGNTGRTFKGLVDEVCFYNRALSQSDIQEQMHFVKNPTTDLTLKGYFQFNETNDVIWNKPDGNFASFSGTATRATSTAPVATGTSLRMSITTSGVKDFPNQHLALDFASGSTLPNGDIVVNELNAAPDQFPTGGTPLSTKYWIINNYGVNAGLTLNSISFNNLTGFAAGSPANYNLFKRNSGFDAASVASGSSWGNALDVADALTTTNNQTLTFSTGNNVTSFSQFTISSISILAVELLDFKAILKDNQVALTWQVADEKDVNHYIIERSFDGKSFDFLTKQEKGKSLSKDETPQYGVNYYRLKIVENDGRFTYSAIRTALFEGTKNKNFNIYPNPTSDRLNIEFIAERPQTVEFELVNMNGQIVYSYRLDSRIGNNRLFFNTSQFPAGLYTLKIKQDKVVSVEKVVLQ
jgi:photosystem II stability/assembly factor-like uncharacterized protein